MNLNLVGAVGGKNFGDELILNLCLDEYRSINDINISISGFNQELVLKTKKSININGINFFNILNNLIKVRKLTGKIKLYDIEAIFSEYDKVDLIHFIGGGYINSLWPTQYVLLAIAYIYSKINKIPIYGTGLGLYPHVKDDEIISLFNSLDLVDLRDKESNIFIPQASFTGDDALLAYNKLHEIIRKDDDQPALIISLQNHLFDGGKVINDILNYDFFINLKAKKINKIIIIESMPSDNIVFSRELYNEALKNGIEIKFLSSYELLINGLPYNSNSFVISSRYHINLLYSMLDVPGVSVYQNEYYRNKHQSIIDMGGHWDVVAVEDIKNILGRWMLGNYFIENKRNNMEFLASKKLELFSTILTNAPSKKTENLSLDSALKIINKYII